MLKLLLILVRHVRQRFRSRYELELENLWLRHQLVVLARNKPKVVRMTKQDRALIVGLYRLMPRLLETLKIIRPEMLVRWHREGFRAYWRRKSSHRAGQKPIPKELQELIVRMRMENPIWGIARIHSELLKLGFDIGYGTVQRYLKGFPRKPSGQNWIAFVRNHMNDIAAIDFFAVPTINFKLLYVLVILEHGRRRIARFAVTRHPTSRWTAQQVAQAFPFQDKPKYLIRDRSSTYGKAYLAQLEEMGIRDMATFPFSPWQNIFVERVIATIRRECTDHVIAFNESQLLRVLHSYQVYYNRVRLHLSLDRDAPEGRPRQSAKLGSIVAKPEVGGLHHRYVGQKAA